MSFNWSYFLVVAEALVQGAEDSSPNEAIYRIAISRAYYAAVCTMRNYLRDKGELLPSDKADVHNEIADWLRKSKDSERQKIGNRLKQLRADRNSADYEDVFYGVPKTVAAQAIQSAKRIIKYVSDNQH